MQSQVRFNTVGFRKRLVRLNKVPGKFPEKVWKVLVQSQVRFNRIPCGKGLGGFGAEPGQVQQGSGEGLGGFSTEPNQI